MSAVITTALGGLMSEFETLFGGLSAELAVAGTVAAPIAGVGVAIAAAVAVGEIFSKEWNKERAKIPNVIKNLSEAIATIQKYGTPLADQRREYTRYSRELKSQQEFVNDFFGFNINLKEAIDKNKELDDLLVKLVLDWTQTLGLAYVAANDNTFYTTHRDDIDTLISVWNSRTDAVNTLTTTIIKTINGIQEIFNFIREAHKMAQAITLTEILPKDTDSPTLDQLADWVERGLVKGRIAELIMKITRSLVRTRTKTKKSKKDEAKRKRRKNRKRPKEKKQPKPNTPRTVRTITANVGNNSAWIQKLIFTFPENEPIDSDRAGTLMVYLKKGNPIKFVRVKRGTFSVIAMWSLGMSFGTGFRVWSQFWKKRIVNVGKVFSWFIPRINQLDREIGIKIEIMEKKVKYK